MPRWRRRSSTRGARLPGREAVRPDGAGRRSTEAAKRSGTQAVLVGHIERFNPAVRQLHEILADGHEILAVDARRMSAVSGRVTDIDVVTDLMVHDIDIVTGPREVTGGGL